ncbi:MAG TPA: hypothetical protein QF730_05995 [Planctomycetota bacterium]|nr:hypothetical protein [Planctomycetota bacterium]
MVDENKTQASGGRHRRWGFVSASVVILALLVVGQGVGVLIGAALRNELGDRAWMLAGFTLFAALYLWTARDSVLAFFRSMHTGVALVTWSAVAVCAGVLVPQIDGFEDPEQRVTAVNYEEQYADFRAAEGYFFYHLLHLYGLGMPAGQVPEAVAGGLDKFSRLYGKEEGDNRRRQMATSFASGPKMAEIAEFTARHDGAFRGFFDLATTLELNRAYKSSWFATLLFLLSVCVGLNTFRGPPRKWLGARKLGGTVTHVGLVAMLIGGGLSKLQSERGIMHMDLRDGPKNEYFRYYDSAKRSVMPFWLKLDRFARKEWKQLEVHFPSEGLTSTPPTYTLWPGRELELDYVDDGAGGQRPDLRLGVLELAESARVAAPDVREAGSADGSQALGPLAKLTLTLPAEEVDHVDAPGSGHDHGPQEMPVFLAPAGQNAHFFDPGWGFRVMAHHGAGPVEGLFPVDDEQAPLLGELSLRVDLAGDVVPRTVPIHLGETVQAPGGFSVTVERAVPNFRLEEGREARDERPLAEVRPDNPGLWVSITGPGQATGSKAADETGEPERRLVLEALDPEETGLQDNYQHEGLVLNFRWSRWNAPGPPRFVLDWSGGNGRLVGEDGTIHEVRLERDLDLPGSSRVTPLGFFDNAVLERSIEFLPTQGAGDGVDDSFYARGARGLTLEVTRHPGTDEEQKSQVRLASSSDYLANWWPSPDERFALRFFENTRVMPFEWRSILSVWQRGAQGEFAQIDLGPPVKREIRVNDYFQHRGYRFFQTNADPSYPTYSGIGVVYDPGIPLVIFGMYTIIVGTVLAFLLWPLTRPARRTGKENGGPA